MSDEAMSCAGCEHRYWVSSRNARVSMSGYGCSRTGGHAMSRCEYFALEDDTDEDDD